MRQHLLKSAHGHLRQEEWFDKPPIIRAMGPDMVNAAKRLRNWLDAAFWPSLSNLESHMVGDAMGQIAHEIERRDRPVRAPGVLLMGGENVVATGPNPGLGGRNSEFVTSAARRIAGSKRIVIGSADSDGSDGPTPNNGGIVDGYTVERARAAGLDLVEDLRTHNTCAFLRGLGDAFDTGILRTNVQDLRVVYVSGRE